MKKISLYFWLLNLALFIFLFMPNLVRHGMFVDGLWYATLSRNLAEGSGTFWQPFLTETFFPTFYSHPPLMFGIQSLFFSIFGDHLFVERLYCLVISLLTIYSIHFFWRYLFRKSPRYRALSFLPVLFWLSNETVYFTYVNNLLEGTLGLFTFWAVFLFYHWSENYGDRGYLPWLKLIGGAILVFLAVLTKGLVALFPLAVPGIYWLLYRKMSFLHLAIYTAFITGIVVISLYLLIQIPAASAYLDGYLDIQLSHALVGESKENLRTTRLHILKMLFERSLPVLILLVLLIGYQYRAERKLMPDHLSRRSLFFILVGLSGTLPIMITLKQVSHYLIPVLPYFSIGFALLAAPIISQLFIKIQFAKWLHYLSWGLLGLFLVYTIGYGVGQLGKIDKRDRQLLTDVMLVGQQVPEGQIIGQELPEVGDMTHCYFYRYYHISIDSTANNQSFILTEKGKAPTAADAYHKVPLSTTLFDLYRQE